MNPAFRLQQMVSRRQFFHGAGLKVGGVALAGLVGSGQLAAASPRSPDRVHPPLPGFPHFPPKRSG